MLDGGVQRSERRPERRLELLVRFQRGRRRVAKLPLEGWAYIAAKISSLGVDAQPLEGEQLDEAARLVYDKLRLDPNSRATAREWELRLKSPGGFPSLNKTRRADGRGARQ